MQRAIIALTRELRGELKRSGTYVGSKLEFLDRYGAKRSELATGPLVLAPWVTSAGSKPAKRRKKVEEPSVVVEENLVTADRPQRVRYKPPNLCNFITELD